MYKLGQYIPGDSLIHKLDPRAKIISVTLLSIIILGGTIGSKTIITFGLLFLISASHLSLRNILTAIRPIRILLILLFLLHLIFAEGSPIPPFPLWGLTITFEGLYQGLFVIWQFTLLIVYAAILTMTTSPSELVIGIERILRPLRILKVPSHDLAIMVSIALRFVPTLLEEMEKLKEAQMARGTNFQTGTLRKRSGAIISLVTPLVLNSFRRADDLAIAMEGRAYKRGSRTYLRELYLSRADYIALVILFSFLGFHLFQEWAW